MEVIHTLLAVFNVGLLIFLFVMNMQTIRLNKRTAEYNRRTQEINKRTAALLTQNEATIVPILDSKGRETDG